MCGVSTLLAFLQNYSDLWCHHVAVNVSAREMLVGTTRVHRSRVYRTRPIRAAILCTILGMATILVGNPSLAIPLVVGAFFAGLCDTAEPVGDHWRSMSWTTMWLTVGTVLGGLSSNIGYFELFTVAGFAFCCGIAGVVGQRGALNGMLALVMFSIFAGTPARGHSIAIDGMFVALGGAIHLIVVVAASFIVDRSKLQSNAGPTSSFWVRLRSGFSRPHHFLRHGLRLALAMVIATALSDVLEWPHEYWIPMTVAWVSRPDFTGTTTRIIERFAGTVLGIAAALLFIDGFALHDYWLCVVAGAGVGLCLAFVRANYSISVIGVTLVIISLFALQGESVGETLAYRLAATTLACVIAALASVIWMRSTA
ncbi:MAG: hypothetical protein F2923_00710 [Actinobacteria bacterium]|uniref:Unannotated protein n=1 Tax=freshwater metagenome TaxID=449393 RepID=A0A6J7GG27_9ZZZZ|nr:hypothetical protein [Actinomycetota bacterium]MTB27141.1 hypothetical protein [Actinomycetota bacterium]